MSVDPCPEISTPRLHLRPIGEADAADLLALWTEPAFVQATALSAAISLEDVQRAAGRYATMNQLGIHRKWAIVDRVSWAFLGECESYPCKPQMQPWNEWALGYSLRHGAWGCGYMREAVQAVLASVFGQPEVCRVRADVLPSNLRSRQLLRAVGFRYEGLQRGRSPYPAGPADEELWGMTRADWLALQAQASGKPPQGASTLAAA